MAKLTYQGHGSCRITTDGGMVIYIDPFAGEGYGPPADLVLITHEHHDHNALQLVTQKPSCTVITEREALAGGQYRRFTVGEAEIEAVPAYNSHHDRRECVGYVVTVDGARLYAAGDTSHTDAMRTTLADRKLDYALLPIDGIYNMGPVEASECARIIGARHSIPIHMAPGELFSREKAEQFEAPGRLILEPGQELSLRACAE